MPIPKKVKLPIRIPRAFVVVAVLAVCALTFSQLTGKSLAAGDAYFILSPSSGTYNVGDTINLTVSIYATSGDNANSAQANLSYPTGTLQYNGYTIDGPFDPNTTGICGQHTGGSGSVAIGCADSAGTISGTTNFATISFTVLVAGSPTISMASGSQIDNNSGSSSIWNGVLPSANYTTNAPVSPSPSPTPSPSPSPNSTGSSSKGTTSKGGTSTGSTSTSPSPSPTPTPSPTPSTTGTSTATGTKSETNGAVTIKVQDGSGKPVDNAKVVLNSIYTEYTNPEGQAGFSSIPSGNYSVVVTANGTSKTESINVPSGQTKLVSVTVSGGTSIVLIAVIGLVAAGVVGGGAFWFLKMRPGAGFGGGTSGPVPPSDIIIGSGAGGPPITPPTTPTITPPNTPPTTPTLIQ